MASAKEEYTISITFTRSGHNNRTPWLFVIHPTGSEKGVRLRVKAVGEIDKPKTNSQDALPPKYSFLAREDAYGMPLIVPHSWR